MSIVDVVVSVALYYRLRAAVLAMLMDVLGVEQVGRLGWDCSSLRREVARRLGDLGVPGQTWNWVRGHASNGYTLWICAPGETLPWPWEGPPGGRMASRVRILRADFRRTDLPLAVRAACDWALSPPAGLVDAAAGFRRRAVQEAGSRSWRLFDEGGGDWLLVCATDVAVDPALRWESDTEEEDDDRLTSIDY